MVSSQKLSPGSADDFETRARNAPEIFRFFNEAGGCARYLAGRWEGTGLQALPEWPVELAMRLRLSADDGAEKGAVLVELQPRPRRSGAGGLIAGLRTLAARYWPASNREESGDDSVQRAVPGTAQSTRAHPAHRAAAGYRAALAFRLSAGSDDSSYGPDYVQLRDGSWELTIQVLENVRAHAQLRILDGLAPIYFSGVLHKVR